MQAIQTKYFGPTNVRGSRFKATCAAGSVTVSMSYPLTLEQNHREAALALCVKLAWDGVMHGGTLADGSMVWVFDDIASPSFTTAI